MGAQSQTQQAQQIDKRAILAVILALKDKDSFVLKYGDIEDALEELVEDEDEYYKVKYDFYDLLYDQRIKGVRNLKYIYYIYEDENDSGEDLIAVSPIELETEQLNSLREVAELLDYGLCPVGNEECESDVEEVVTKTINGLIRKWSLGCRTESTPARAAYEIAKAYNLDVREVGFVPANVGSGGSVTYSIENIVKVKQIFWYCNDCIVRAGNNFIEKCSTWEFIDEEDSN
jgi:hypothetical protein